MLTVTLTQGLPASGKSTWAKKMVEDNPGRYTRINKDDLRATLHLGRFSKPNERVVLAVRDATILAALEQGQHVIVDDTNFHEKHLKHIKELVKDHPTQVQVILKKFDASLHECIERDAEREEPVGAKIIADMHQRFIVPNQFKLKQDKSLLRAIVVDIDGTLALFEGDVPDEAKRNPYDASKCENDIVNEAINTIIENFKGDHKIILASGRKGTFMPQTKNWLKKTAVPDDYLLFMRNPKDNRPDYEIKKDIYYQQIYGRYYVVFVLDDRNQTVDFWRSVGLTCLQVNYGNF